LEAGDGEFVLGVADDDGVEFCRGGGICLGLAEEVHGVGRVLKEGDVEIAFGFGEGLREFSLSEEGDDAGALLIGDGGHALGFFVYGGGGEGLDIVELAGVEEVWEPLGEAIGEHLGARWGDLAEYLDAGGELLGIGALQLAEDAIDLELLVTGGRSWNRLGEKMNWLGGG
jgi:hypothetical protein